MRQELQEWLRFLRAESNVLRGDSSRLFQQAMNQPDSSAPARAALARFEAGRETRPWFRWINKPDRYEPEILRISGHVGQVLRCAYAADKHQLVSVSQQLRHYADKSDTNQPTELIWWNVATGAMISTHPLDVELTTAAAFSGDARILALAVNPFRQLSKDKRLSDPNIPRSIKLIDTASGSLTAVLRGCDKQITSCSFSSAGTQLITGDVNGTVRVWDVNSHLELLRIPAHVGAIRTCAFSPGGRVMVTADSEELKFWDANDGENLRTLGLKSVTECAFLSDQRLAVSTNELLLINVSTGETLCSAGAGGKGSIGVLGISPDAPVMVTGRGGYILRLWQADVLADIGRFRGHEDPVTSVAFLQPGSRQIASSANDGTIRIWELPHTSEGATFAKHMDEVNKVIFLGDTNRLVSGGDDEFVRVWEGDTAEELFTIPVGAHGASALACTSDSQHLAVGGWWYEEGSQGFLAVWRIEGTTASKVAEVNAGCVACAYSPDGKFLAAINEWTHLVTIYTGQELEEVARLSEDRWKPKACTFSPDGELLIVAGDDLANQLKLRLFHTAGWKEVTRIETGQWRATDCAISPDGRLIAAASRSSGLAIVEMKTGKVSLIGNAGNLTSCSFSPDGSRVVCGTEEKTLEIWDLPDRKKVGVLAGHSALVSDCEWSPDGESIVSCSRDGLAKLWDPTMVAESSDEPEMRGSVSACRYSPDNRFVLTMGKADSSLKLWNRANGALVSQLPSRVEPRQFAYAPEVGYAFASIDDGELILFTLEGQVLRKLEGDRNPIVSFALSPQGERLAVIAGLFNAPKLYDGRTLSQIGAIVPRQQNEIVGRCSFSPDGSMLIAGSNQRLNFLDATSTQPRYQIANGSSYGRGEKRSWAVSPDGALLALIRKDIDDEDASASLQILALKEQREIISFDIEDDDIARCCFSPDGRFFALAASAAKLRILDVRAGRELEGVNGESLSDFRYSADGSRICISAGERMRVFDSATLQHEAEFVVNQSITSFDLAVDGQSLTIGGVRGNLLFLDAFGLDSRPPIMTGVCFYNFETKKWSKEPAVRCAWCGIVVRVREEVVEAIREIERAAKLTPADVPSLSLPDEAWSDPRLLSDCIACRTQLRFNPFLNDFHNRLPRPAGSGPASIMRKFWRNAG